MTESEHRRALLYRTVVTLMGAAMVFAYAPQCGMYLQMREVAGYYECVRPQGVSESILISGYGSLTWSAGADKAQYLFELNNKDTFRLATPSASGEPTVWRTINYTRQGDELWFAPRLPGSGCERWVSRKGPSKLPPNSVANPLQWVHADDAARRDRLTESQSR